MSFTLLKQLHEEAPDAETTERMRVILTQHPQLLNESSSSSSTLLHYASLSCNLQRMTMLLDMGADINLPAKRIAGFLEFVPATFIFWKNHNLTQTIPIFKFLIKRGACLRLFHEHMEFLKGSFGWNDYDRVKLATSKVIADLDQRRSRCRSSLLCFIWCCKLTGLIHPNVGREIIARRMLWQTRLKKIWNKRL